MESQIGMHEQQKAELYAALGDHMTGGRPDGLFSARLGGPGSVAGLADLGRADRGAAEWQLEVLPFPPTAAQQEALTALGYVRREERPERWTFARPHALEVVVLNHELSAAFDQQVLWTFLRVAPEDVQARYRQTFLTAGRDTADTDLLPVARAGQVARIGFGPLERAAELIRPLGLPWMFAAGWALDIHHRAPSRPHEDVDIVVPREGQFAVGRALVKAGYRVFAVRDGAYCAWDEPLPPPHFQVHAHREEGETLDLMLSDLSGGLWRYRRDPEVTLPLGRVRRFSPDGLPYLTPEAALLFKARSANGGIRPKDQRDFTAALPGLDAEARAWLAAHLPAGHAWKPLLGA